jgi:hypothetical protein
MSSQVGRIGLLVLAASACSGVADPMGLQVAAGGDLQTVLDGAVDAKSELDAGWVQPEGGGAAPATLAPDGFVDASLAGDGGPGDAGPGASDATLVDAASEAGTDGFVGASVDKVEGAAPEAATTSCFVTFTVADAFIDGVIDTGVALGGDVSALGNWNPDAAASMTSLGGGAWTVSLLMNDGDEVQFLFVKLGPSSYIWEDWGANSNRSLVVSCGPDADASAPFDGGPVMGTSYAGEFGVKPPDAT